MPAVCVGEPVHENRHALHNAWCLGMPKGLTWPTSFCATVAPACLSVAPSMYFPATAAAEQHIGGQEQLLMPRVPRGGNSRLSQGALLDWQQSTGNVFRCMEAYRSNLNAALSVNMLSEAQLCSLKPHTAARCS